MKIDNTGYIIKGILLAVCGVLFAFFPGVLSWVFYIIGGIIIAGSILTGLSSFGGGDGGSLMPAGIVGVLVGLFVIYIPRFISRKMSVIAGIILAVIAVTQIIKSLSKELTKKLKIFQLIFGIILLISSVFLMFNPFGGKIIRFIIGLIMLAFAIFNFYVAYVISERNGEVITTSNDVIDTSGFEVNNDNDIKRLQ